MDLLDRTYPAARDLLDRIDATLLAAGAPPDHPVLALLRRVGALPGDVVAQLAVTPPDPLTAAGDPLRRQAESYDSAQASVPSPAAWRGPAAESFAAQWSAVSAHLAGDPETMAGRLEATATYLDDVASWLARGRRAVAGVLAECLGSMEAATLRAAPVAGAQPSWSSTVGGSRDAIRAAADLGAHVLACAAEVVGDGQRVVDTWAGRLDEMPPRAGDAVAAPTGGQLEIG